LKQEHQQQTNRDAEHQVEVKKLRDELQQKSKLQTQLQRLQEEQKQGDSRNEKSQAEIRRLTQQLQINQASQSELEQLKKTLKEEQGERELLELQLEEIGENDKQRGLASAQQVEELQALTEELKSLRRSASEHTAELSKQRDANEHAAQTGAAIGRC